MVLGTQSGNMIDVYGGLQSWGFRDARLLTMGLSALEEVHCSKW
jgi:hypothetical protein